MFHVFNEFREIQLGTTTKQSEKLTPIAKVSAQFLYFDFTDMSGCVEKALVCHAKGLGLDSLHMSFCKTRVLGTHRQTFKQRLHKTFYEGVWEFI